MTAHINEPGFFLYNDHLFYSIFLMNPLKQLSHSKITAHWLAYTHLCFQTLYYSAIALCINEYIVDQDPLWIILNMSHFEHEKSSSFITNKHSNPSSDR